MERNLPGSRKLSKLNSSSMLFCSGVPVSKTLCSYKMLNKLDYIGIKEKTSEINVAVSKLADTAELPNQGMC